ncbi:MAG: hypothetical protein QW231_02000 [Candidatus Bathyarchaeia archaeon]
MVKRETAGPLPLFNEKEKEILDEIKGAGGDLFRTDLRQKIGGSNTTFVKRILNLKEKGLIEEYKRREGEKGRLKTAYRFTEYANRLFDVENALKMEKWFSASQKIELFPEFEKIAQTLLGGGFNVYEMLGIEPQHMFLETLLATSKPPNLREEEIREVLTMCNALFQNIITGRLYSQLQDQTEGYIIFHYMLEKPKEELQRLLPQVLIEYVSSTDILKQHKARSRMVELTIQYSQLVPMITMAAVNIARSLKLEGELQDLLKKYKAFKEGEEPFQLTRTQLVLSVLNIFKKLYDSLPPKV